MVTAVAAMMLQVAAVMLQTAAVMLQVAPVKWGGHSSESLALQVISLVPPLAPPRLPDMAGIER